jgi:hypothetical protein
MIVICDTGKKLFYIEHGYLCRGLKGKRTPVKKSSVRRIGLVEESFLQNESGFVYGSYGERYTNPKLRGKNKTK